MLSEKCTRAECDGVVLDNGALWICGKCCHIYGSSVPVDTPPDPVAIGGTFGTPKDFKDTKDYPQGLANLGYNISLRDIFAGMAMQAFVTNSKDGIAMETLVKSAYTVADRMIEAREK